MGFLLCGRIRSGLVFKKVRGVSGGFFAALLVVPDTRPGSGPDFPGRNCPLANADGPLGGQGGAAGLLAAPASFGTVLAVVQVGTVLFALGGADAADFGALAHDVPGVLRPAGYETGGNGADIGTVAVDADAASHHFHLLLLQAGSSALLAGGNAGIEGVEQALRLVIHGKGSKV